MGRRPLRFQSKGAYQRWNAYREMHVEGQVPHRHEARPVVIAGHPHTVHHCGNCGGATRTHYHGTIACDGRPGCCVANMTKAMRSGWSM